jgi:metal-responsive CopG/Arc/MetJ family transcriptional regulator
MSVRTTVQLDQDLAERVRKLVPPRGLNRFINQAVEDRVKQLEREQLEARMKEGYLATREDRDELNQDWQDVDLEDWPA